MNDSRATEKCTVGHNYTDTSAPTAEIPAPSADEQLDASDQSAHWQSFRSEWKSSAWLKIDTIHLVIILYLSLAAWQFCMFHAICMSFPRLRRVCLAAVLKGGRRRRFTCTNMHAPPFQLCKQEDRKGWKPTDREGVRCHALPQWK